MQEALAPLFGCPQGSDRKTHHRTLSVFLSKVSGKVLDLLFLSARSPQVSFLQKDFANMRNHGFGMMHQ